MKGISRVTIVLRGVENDGVASDLRTKEQTYDRDYFSARNYRILSRCRTAYNAANQLVRVVRASRLGAIVVKGRTRCVLTIPTIL